MADQLLIHSTGEQGGMAGISKGKRQVSYDFTDRVVLVTGSSHGIGLAIADAFSSAGASVVVNGRKVDAVEVATSRLAEAGGRVLGLPADVRKYDDVLALVDQAERTFGNINILVNNAGGNFGAPLESLSPNGWRAVVETNLTSVFLCAKACLPGFRRAGNGVIVNIGSVGSLSAHPQRGHYAAAKAGVHSLTMTMAHEWARYNVRVNCVAPGAILTDASRFSDPFVRAEAERDIPLGRLGRPWEVADACVYLASEQASFVTGALLRVDGGPRSAVAELSEAAHD